MPARLDAESSFAFGRALAPLASEGVLVIGSGSLTHNLYEVRPGGPDEVYVGGFSAWVRQAILADDHDRLRKTLEMAPHARRAHPTPEHFWPLLVAAGAATSSQPVTIIDGGITHGVLAMDAFLFGQKLAPNPQTEVLSPGKPSGPSPLPGSEVSRG
jgi:4,5-DOPA dioxygenase extradiol